MKKKFVWLLLATMSLSLAGCGKKSQNDNASDSPSSAVILSDYGDVELCDYKGLSETKNIYKVTEDDVDSEIESMLYDYIEYVDVLRPSEDGDYVDVRMTAKNNGELIYDFSDSDGYSIYIGYEEFGPEFDEKLTGVSAGDHLSFTVSYASDYDIEELSGLDVDYDVDVIVVTEERIPELNEDFITNTLGYESEADLREEITAEREASNEESSETELRELLLQQVISGSTFANYPQELYDNCATEIREGYESYVEMFGAGSLDELYEMFGMTEEDIEEEILSQVYRTMAVNAIADKEGIEITDDEYKETLDSLVIEAEVESTDELLAIYSEASIKYWILEEKVLDILEENAVITEVEAESSSAFFDEGMEIYDEEELSTDTDAEEIYEDGDILEDYDIIE